MFALLIEKLLTDGRTEARLAVENEKAKQDFYKSMVLQDKPDK